VFYFRGPAAADKVYLSERLLIGLPRNFYTRFGGGAPFTVQGTVAAAALSLRDVIGDVSLADNGSAARER